MQRSMLPRVRNRKRSAPSARGRAPKGVERLESRTLLSVGPNPYESGGPVTLAPGAGASGYVGGQGAWEAPPTYLPTSHNLLRYDGYLTGPSTDAPLSIATGFLRSHAADLALTPDDLAGMVVTDQYTTGITGTTYLYFRQAYRGLEIANANAHVSVDDRGRVISASSTFLHDVGRQVVDAAARPSLSAVDAVYSAAGGLGLNIQGTPIVLGGPLGASQATTVMAKGVSLDQIPAKLHYVAGPDGVHLAWDLIARTPDGDHWYNTSIDAISGSLLANVDWVDHASYNVFALPSQSPDDSPRTILTDPNDPVASPFGWHDTDGVAGAEFTDTRGNNVSAQEDTDANNTGGFRPDGGPSLNFDFPLDLTQQPSAYQSAAITNLFYVNNALHDIHYHYGFDEAAGNFQVNDYGRGGVGGDPVQADAQDGSGTDNANFATPPDGLSPRMQMYLFDVTNPNRDGDLDNEIIIHEFGHGISNRLTGGPSNSDALDALQSGGMGEGWSDWWSLMLTQKTTDGKFDAYPTGNYVLGQPPNGPGIRRYPYSFDMGIDPLTIGEFNGGFPNNEVHNTGEIWTSTLWDMSWLLVDKYGFNPNLYAGYTGPGSAGNILALQLVMDALKLQPANPSFKDARDAILMADQNLTGGANQREIWTAFARRGMGLSFVDTDANSGFVIPAFDTPDFDLHVTSTDPAAGSILTARPTDFTVNFNDAYDPAAVDAADFTVNGTPADSVVQVDADTLRFHYNASPVVNQGIQTMAIAAGAIDRLGDDAPIDAFSASFRYDALLMQVTSTVPADGSLAQLPLTSIRVNFNEPYDPATVGTDDLAISQGTVTGFTLIDADTVQYDLAGITHEGTLTINIAAGALTDVFGNPMAAYSGSLILDIGTIAYPTPLTPVAPLGSLVYDPTVDGTIGVPDDADSFTITLDLGQTATVVVSPSSTLRPIVELAAIDDGLVRLIAKANSAGPGKDAVIQAVPTTAASPKAQGGPRTYQITVRGANHSTGDYHLKLILNAAVENEDHGIGTDDTLAKAQKLDSGFTKLFDGSATRAAVLGTIRGGTSPGDVFVAVRGPNGFGGQINHYDKAGNFVGAIDSPVFDTGVISDVELGPNNDLFVALDVGGDGGDGDLVRFDLSGGQLAVIPLPPDSYFGYFHPFGFDVAPDGTFWVAQPNSGNVVHVDVSGALIASFYVGGIPEDAALAPSGLVYVAEFGQILALDPTTGVSTPFVTGPTSLDLNVTPSGDVLVGDFYSGVERFAPDGTLKQFIPAPYPTEPQDTPGGDTWVTSFANQSLSRYGASGNLLSFLGLSGNPIGLAVVGTDAPPPSTPVDNTDYYALTMSPNQSVTVSATALNGGKVTVDLLDATGTLLATGRTDAANVGSIINNLLVTKAGTYYVRVTGSPGVKYNLVVTRNADFDSESNDSFATAQDLTSAPIGKTRYVLGAITGGARLFAVADDGTSSITELDPTTGAEIHRFAAPEPISQGPDGLAFDGNSLYYINGFGTHNLWELDPNTGAVRSSTPITSGSGSYDGLAAVGGKIYITDYGFDTILEFDPSSHSVTRTLDVGALNPGVFLVGGLAGIASPNALIATSNFGQQVVEIDPATGLVTHSFSTFSTYYGVAVEDGQIYLGTPFGPVDVYSRDGTFQRTFFLPYGVSALGGDDVATAVDVYRTTIDAGKTLEVETTTPGGGAGEFVNAFDPMIRIFDASGNLVASDDNSAPDGRNANLKFKVPAGAGGTYFIEVSASTATPKPNQGEYALSVKGENDALPPFRVKATNPPDGAVMKSAPAQIEVDFNDVALLPTLQASDLTVDGVPATGLTIASGDVAIFTLPIGLGDGTHTVAIATGALKDVQGTPIDAYVGHFTLDTTPPRVVASSIQEGGILAAGDLTYTVTFSERMNTSNLDPFDFSLVSLIRGQFFFPDSWGYDSTGTVLTIHYSNLPDDDYSLTLYSFDGGFEDVVGNNLDGEPLAWPIPPNASGDGLEGGNFFVDFATDNGTLGMPTPLVPVAPAGSLIYQSGTPAVGTIAFAGDTDDYTIDLGAGQTLAVLADPAPFQQLTITVRDPHGAVIGTAASGTDGAEAVLRAVPATDAGTYTITIGSNGALGLYSVRVLVNADLEAESLGDGTNNDTGSAQALDPSFIPLGDGRDRAAVLGSFHPSQLVTNGSFETGDFTGWTAFETGSPFVPWLVSPAGNGSGFFPPTSPQDGNFDAWNGFDGAGPMEYFLQQDVAIPAGATAVTLSWDDRIQWDFALVGIATQPRTYDVQILDPSTNAVLATLYSFSTGTDHVVGDTGWQSHSADLLAFAGSTVRLQFHEVIPESFTGPGQIEFDAIAIDATPGEQDNYSVSLNAGQSASVALTGLVGTGDHIDITDAGGNVLASGVAGATNLDEAINNFVAPSTGTYFIRITGTAQENYSLVVTRGADFDTEGNDSFDTAQDITVPRAALGDVGHLSSSGFLTFDELPFRSVDGLHYKGVTFGYTEGGIPSPNAYYAAFGPGYTLYTSDPSLIGNADGVLTLTLDRPESSLQFGVVLSANGTFSPGATVDLYDASSTLIGSFPVTTSDHGYYWSEALFAYSGTPVAQAVIRFDSSVASQFALDNLQFSSADAEDWYGVDASAGDDLSFVTSTPGDGPGEFVNTLDPHIELYDPSGALVASGTTLSDGRNEQLTYTATVSGRYRIRIVAENGTSGEYILAPAPSSPGLRAQSLPTGNGSTGTGAAGASPTGGISRSVHLDDLAIHQIFGSQGSADRLATILGQLDDDLIRNLIGGTGISPGALFARAGKKPGAR